MQINKTLGKDNIIIGWLENMQMKGIQNVCKNPNKLRNNY